jgi:hypothetical protein
MVRVRFLGTDSQNGGSPTLYETDRGTLVVRGYAITDEQALADLGDVPAGELDIEIPAELLRFFERPMTDDPRYRAAREDETSTP